MVRDVEFGHRQKAQVFTAGMTLDSAYAIHTGEDLWATWLVVAREDGPPEGEMPEGGPPAEGEDGDISGPPGQSRGEQVLGAATGLGIHKAEGIWPTTMQGACNVPGLFAAGDGLASMLCGSSYVGLGMSLERVGSPRRTQLAGRGGIREAGSYSHALGRRDHQRADGDVCTPRARDRVSPAWVTQVLQNTMFPYFVLFVKQQDRLEAALSTITFLRENMVPRLTAKDAH